MNKIFRAFLIVLIIVWTLAPLYELVVMSIASSGSIGALLPGKITLKYYAEILFGARFGAQSIWPFMAHSIIVCGLASLAVILFSLPCAYAFSRLKSKTSQGVYLGYFVLRMLPSIALLVPWYFILRSLHLIDTYSGLSIIYLLFQLPVGIWLMKGFFDTIPVELEEGAWIEGASVFTAFRKIIVPLAGNGIAVTGVFVFLYSYIELMYSSVLTRQKITLPPYLSGFVSVYEVHYQLTLAASLISTIPMIVLFLFAQRYMTRGITGGALKY